MSFKILPSFSMGSVPKGMNMLLWEQVLAFLGRPILKGLVTEVVSLHKKGGVSSHLKCDWTKV